jgi:hypothetical protein
VVTLRQPLKNWSLKKLATGFQVCDGANALQFGVFQLNRRMRRRLYAATGVLSLAMWLLLTVAEGYTPLHAWIHGGSIPDNDDCAIVALAHGQVDSPVADVPTVAQIIGIEVTPHVEFSAFSPAIKNLPSGRAPPVLPTVS